MPPQPKRGKHKFYSVGMLIALLVLGGGGQAIYQQVDRGIFPKWVEADFLVC